MAKNGVPVWGQEFMGQLEESASRAFDPYNLPRSLEWYMATWVASAMETSAKGVMDDHDNDVASRVRFLLTRRFTRRAVFDERRWNDKNALLERAFHRRRHEFGDVSFAEAWRRVAEPVLVEALLSLPPDVACGGRFPWVLRHLQREIERALLGRTVDSKLEVLAGDLTPEGVDGRDFLEHVEMIRSEAALWDEGMSMLREFLHGLTPDDQAILKAEHGDDAALANRQGVTTRTIRRQRARLKEKLKVHFAATMS